MDDTPHIVIDTRGMKMPEEAPRLFDLVIEIDLFDDGYVVGYLVRGEGDAYRDLDIYAMRGIERAKMVEQHVNVMRAVKPKSVAIRTGRHSTGHIKDIPLHPLVINNVLDGKFNAEDLTL